jgi:hypothetical protein
MALELKKRSKLFLKSQKVNVDETTSSPESFGISELPPYFGEGKNSFKIKPGAGYLKSGTEIQFEILDSNGNPIYWETSTYKDSDNSRLVSVWVYDLPTNKKYDTPDGRAELIVVATLKSGGIIRWTKKIDVVKSKQSPSNIVFLTTPKSTISSSVETFTNKIVENNQLIKTIDSTTAYYKKSVFGDTVSIERTSGDTFNGEMVGGNVYIDFSSTTLYPILGGGQSQPTSFTSSILEVVSSNVMRIGTALTSSDNRSDGSIHTYEYSNQSVGVEIEYYSTGSDTSTQNQIAFANISLTNVNPIGGRVYSVRTSIKSDGLSNSDYSVIGDTKVQNTSSFSYKVPIPTEQLNDPKTLRLQFVNELGNVSTTELITSGLVFTGGNVYIAGNQSLITGSFNIGNSIGTGIEMAGFSSGYLKSVGYDGMTSASLGKGPGGFLIWSGSGNLQIGENQYPGVGMEMVSQGGSSSFYFTTHDGGRLSIVTDEFFIGNVNTQFISGSNGNIEISSSFFHLNPYNQSLLITSGGNTMIDTTTGYSDGKNIARHLPIQSTTDQPFIIFLDGETKLVVQAISQGSGGGGSTLSGTLGIRFQRFLYDQSPAPQYDTGSWTFTDSPDGITGERRVIRHIVDLDDVGNYGVGNYDLQNNPVFIQVTGSNIQNTQVQVTAHRNVGAGGSKPGGSGLGAVVETT